MGINRRLHSSQLPALMCGWIVLPSNPWSTTHSYTYKSLKHHPLLYLQIPEAPPTLIPTSPWSTTHSYTYKSLKHNPLLYLQILEAQPTHIPTSPWSTTHSYTFKSLKHNPLLYLQILEAPPTLISTSPWSTTHSYTYKSLKHNPLIYLQVLEAPPTLIPTSKKNWEKLHGWQKVTWLYRNGGWWPKTWPPFFVKIPLKIPAQMHRFHMVSSAHNSSKSRTICTHHKYLQQRTKG